MGVEYLLDLIDKLKIAFEDAERSRQAGSFIAPCECNLSNQRLEGVWEESF